MNNSLQVKDTPIVKIEHLKTYYPIKKGLLSRVVANVKAVDDVSFEIYENETLGLVGESGCGKSTIARTILSLEEPTAGKALFEGENIFDYSPAKMREKRQDFQIIFQDPYSSLNPRKRIEDILSEPLLVHKIVQKNEVSNRIDELLDLVGLPTSYKNRYPHEFSGGQRQRIGIARALSMNPKLIICDEPVSALDVSIQAQVLNLLKDLQKELGLTYLFIAHGLGAVKYISDRIAVMYLGKIVEIGETKDLFESPQHPYTEILLNAYPIPNPRLRSKERIVVEGDVPSPVNPPSGCRFHTRCPFAQPICKEKQPELVSKGNRAVACHFPIQH